MDSGQPGARQSHGLAISGQPVVDLLNVFSDLEYIYTRIELAGPDLSQVPRCKVG